MPSVVGNASHIHQLQVKAEKNMRKVSGQKHSGRVELGNWKGGKVGME